MNHWLPHQATTEDLQKAIRAGGECTNRDTLELPFVAQERFSHISPPAPDLAHVYERNRAHSVDRQT